MIDYSEEIMKFQPSLDIDQAEEAIIKNDMTDLSDIIDTILKNTQKRTDKE